MLVFIETSPTTHTQYIYTAKNLSGLCLNMKFQCFAAAFSLEQFRAYFIKLFTERALCRSINDMI